VNILLKFIFFIGSVVFLGATPTAARAQLDQPTRAAVQLELLTPGRNSSVQTPGSVQRMVVSLLINGQEQSQFLILLLPGGIPEVRLPGKLFLEKIEEFVSSDIQQKLLAAVDSEGNLTLEALRQNGLEATFDWSQLQLQIQVPFVQQQMNIYKLLALKLPSEAKGTLHPSLGSGYIFNLQDKKEYAWSEQKASTQGRQPINLNLEGALNLKGWMLQGSSNSTEAVNSTWALGNLSLEQNAPDQASRLAVGDLSIPVIGYQSSRPTLGITVAREFVPAGNLLAPGKQQFTYGFGFASTENQQQGGRTYDWAEPTLTLSHRWGLTDTLTLGGYLQNDLKQQLAGIEGVWATSCGKLRWDLALSNRSGTGFDYAVRLDYDYVRDSIANAEQRSFGFTLENRGPDFTTLDYLSSYTFDFSAYYSQKLFWGIRGRLSGGYQVGDAGVINTYIVSLELSKSFENGLKVNLNLRRRLEPTHHDEQNAYLSLSWSFPG